MNDSQKEIIKVIVQLGENVQNGLMSPTAVPIEPLRDVLASSLFYRKNDKRPDEIAGRFKKLLSNLADSNELYSQTIFFLSDILSLWFEREELFQQTLHAYEKVFEDKFFYNEIVEKYAQDKIDDEYVSNRTYRHLATILKRNKLELFKNVAQKIHEVNIKRLRNKEKIKIAFLIQESATWSCESLYQKLNESDRFEVYIAVALYTYGTDETMRRMYQSTIKYFEDKGFKTFGLYNLPEQKNQNWEEIGMPDIVFNLCAYALNESASIENFPLNILNVYIPYGVMAVRMENNQFNMPLHMFCWKIFCESEFHKKLAKKHSAIGDVNVINSGYVKMDAYFSGEAPKADKIWKFYDSCAKDSVKKIIYAPHWSISNVNALGFGGFDKIYREIYEYAKQHKETTSWVFRPHPLLSVACIEQGLFANEKEFYDYLELWNQLPNAKVMLGGTYYDLFKTSDTMIFDSVSFMSEYLYVHKPLLFLTRDRQSFNDYGEELIKVLYTADGGAFANIVDFIDNVVIQGNDYMKNDREVFFEKHLNYVKHNGKSAGNFIYDYLNDALRF